MRKITYALTLWLILFPSCTTPRPERLGDFSASVPPVAAVVANPGIAADTQETARIEIAMAILASTEKTTLKALTPEPRKVAQAISESARLMQMDPLLLVTIAWTESRYRPGMLGDHGKSCGLFQIQNSKAYKSRPSCKQLMDPVFAAAWAADFLTQHPLESWNGHKYAEGIRRRLTWLQKQLVTPS